MERKGPFYDLRQAAEYCGYKPASLAKLLRDYALPRYGPKKTRYSESDLDAWMQNPDAFREDQAPRRRKPQVLKVEV